MKNDDQPGERRKPVVLTEEQRKSFAFWAPKTLEQIERRNADIKLWSMKSATPLVQ
jgi:hypothetical protein